MYIQVHSSCLFSPPQLTEHKSRTEFALEAKALPLEVVIECLTLREQREAIDRVRDEVEAELKKVRGEDLYVGI